MSDLTEKFFPDLPHAMNNQLYHVQGCHWSGESQGNSRSGKSQGILEFVREIWNFVESQGNSRKVREIQEKSGKFKNVYIS